MSFHELPTRSVIKALTFRAIILFTDSIVVYLLTKKLDLAVGFVILSNLVSTIVYFFHERAWNHIHWGKTHIKK